MPFHAVSLAVGGCHPAVWNCKRNYYFHQLIWSFQEKNMKIQQYSLPFPSSTHRKAKFCKNNPITHFEEFKFARTFLTWLQTANILIEGARLTSWLGRQRFRCSRKRTFFLWRIQTRIFNLFTGNWSLGSLNRGKSNKNSWRIQRKRF